MDNLKVKNLTNSCFVSHFRSDSRDSIADNVQKTNTPSLKVSTRSFSVYHVYYYYFGSFSLKTFMKLMLSYFILGYRSRQGENQEKDASTD